MRLSTRARLSLLAMAAVAPALAIADVALLLSVNATANSEVDHDLAAQATLLQAGIDDANGQLSFGARGSASGPVTASAAIVRDGGVVAATGSSPLPSLLAVSLANRATAASGAVFSDARTADGVPERVYAAPLGTTDQPASGVIVVNRSVAAVASETRQTLGLAVLLSSLTLILTGVIARWLAGRVLRPVRTIAGLARTISDKDLHRRVTTSVPADELGELVDTFNAMLSRLEAEFEVLRRFTADASHELRAPLSIMSGELELSLARPRPVEEYRESQRRLLGETQHLTSIAERLLLLARADGGTLVADRVPVDINDLLTETAERWRTAADARGMIVTVEASDGGTVLADPALLRQVLDNLVDNVLKHAPSSTDVALRARLAPDGVEIDIADNGTGVPAATRPLLFGRFVRALSARTPGAPDGGAGLGLALSWSIARAHHGDLVYVDTPDGATFRLRLPGEQPALQ